MGSWARRSAIRERARFSVPGSKTETGIRDVEISPDLVEVIVMYIDRLRRAATDAQPPCELGAALGETTLSGSVLAVL